MKYPKNISNTWTQESFFGIKYWKRYPKPATAATTELPWQDIGFGKQRFQSWFLLVTEFTTQWLQIDEFTPAWVQIVSLKLIRYTNIKYIDIYDSQLKLKAQIYKQLKKRIKPPWLQS